MNRVSGVVRMHMRDKWVWILIPWAILLSSFLINLLVFTFVGSGEENYTGGLMSIFVYICVTGILVVPNSFPFALGLGVRRKDFFAGTAAVAISLNLAFSVALIVLSAVEQATDGWGVRLNFFRIYGLSDGPIAAWGWMMFVGLLNMFFLGFFFACWHRKFGRNGLFVLFTALALVLGVAVTLCTYYDGWDDLGRLLERFSPVQLFTWMLIPAAVYAGVSYLLLRRSTV